MEKMKALFYRLANRSLDLAFLKPIAPYWRRRLKGKLMVYLYHRVEGCGSNTFLDQGGSPVTSPEQFKEDLLFLKSMNATFIRVADIEKCEFKADIFYVAITIDDGFACAYTQAVSIANELDVPLTIFQCSAMLQGESAIWEHQLYWLLSKPNLKDKFIGYVQKYFPDINSFDTIREALHPDKVSQILSDFFADQQQALLNMQAETANLYPSVKLLNQAIDNGHEVGSHGHVHMKRESINSHDFKQELTKSKQVLQKLCDAEPTSFSYPFNSYKEHDHGLVKEQYRQTVTVDGGAIKTYTGEPIPRCTWPGPPKSKLRQRRWLYTGRI